MTVITLKKGEGRTIKSGGAWVYDNEIATIEDVLPMAMWLMYMTLTATLWVKASSTRIQPSESVC